MKKPEYLRLKTGDGSLYLHGFYQRHPYYKGTSMLIGNWPRPWMRYPCRDCGRHYSLSELKIFYNGNHDFCLCPSCYLEMSDFYSLKSQQRETSLNSKSRPVTPEAPEGEPVAIRS